MYHQLCMKFPPLASLARPADGFLDLGRMGLVFEPLIQGKISVDYALKETSGRKKVKLK